MKKIILILLGFFAFNGLYGQKAEKNYTTYCMACHGKKLEGGTASSLIKTDWLHGGDKASIIKTISKGVAKTSMVAWGAVISKKEIEELADYILSKQAKK